MRAIPITSFAVLLYLTLSTVSWSQSNDGNLRPVNIDGARLNVPIDCKTLRAEEVVFDCRLPASDGKSFITIAMFSHIYERFSTITSLIPEMEVSEEEDLKMVLGGYVKYSQEGVGGLGHRMILFSDRKFGKSNLPEGADACRLVNKREEFYEVTRNLSMARQELACATLVGKDQVLLAVAIYAVTFPSSGKGLSPPNFKENAKELFSSFAIEP